jgi:signal transduction histidine kinase
MLKNFSPQILLAFCSTVCVLIAGITIAMALQAPWAGIEFNVIDNRIEILGSSVASPNPNLPHFKAKDFVAANEIIPASAVLLIEEPDVLPSYEQYNQFIAWQRQLTQAAQTQQLTVRAEDGREFLLATAPRPLASLPLMFWLQLFFGAGGALTGALVWSTRRHSISAQLYALTGVGYLIFAPAAAIYSTRELMLDGELFRFLSVLNHFGALMFTASLTSLLWCYPNPISPRKKTRYVALIYVLALFFWVTDALQLFSPAVFHFGVLGVFSLSFIFAAIQWRRTRTNPIDRAALRWFLLSIYLATGLFAAVIILPAALHLPQPASQGVMFGAFLLMYWGLALGIVHYRLFSLEQWWHSIMAWFLGGVCVLVLDVILIASLALPEEIALSLAVAFTGWLYFPLRQLLWDRFGQRKAPAISDWLGQVLPLLMANDRDNQAWPISLQRVWQALEVKRVPGTIAVPEIVDDGLALNVQDIDPLSKCYFQVRCANNGQRLFNQLDIQTFFSLQKIGLLALQISDARSTGAEQERQRIRRDIHDDMGAKLLTLLHTCPEHIHPQVRELLQTTRELVHALNSHPVNAITASDSWYAEAQQRCDAAGVELNWNHHNDALPQQLAARTHVNLTRILREAVSNALKHATPSNISVTIKVDQGVSQIIIFNDGHSNAAHTWEEGNGCRIMLQRAEEIGGKLSWKIERGCTLTLHLPFTPH